VAQGHTDYIRFHILDSSPLPTLCTRRERRRGEGEKTKKQGYIATMKWKKKKKSRTGVGIIIDRIMIL
jgi:hypothetical protein